MEFLNQIYKQGTLEIKATKLSGWVLNGKDLIQKLKGAYVS